MFSLRSRGYSNIPETQYPTAKELTNGETPDVKDPPSFKVVKYCLHILIPEFPSLEFGGKVKINCQINRCTKLSFNSVELKIESIAFQGENVSFSIDSDYVFISLKTVFTGDGVLEIAYSGTLSNGKDVGFFRSKTDRGYYIGCTHFEPTAARRAFPCIDSPNQKSIYSVQITHPAEYRAYSNAAVAEIQAVSPEIVTTFFQDTIPLSTYLVAWCVEKSYDFVSAKSGSGIVVKILHPKNQKSTAFSLNVALKSLDYLESVLSLKLPISKIDFFPVPDFPGEGMENMGLVTIETGALLRNEADSLYLKTNTALLIAHELAHYWFGNLVTMSSWNDLWLNEGFAEYFQYEVCSFIFPDWDLKSHFFALEHLPALRSDSSSFSRPLIANSLMENIAFLFDHISYYKGASIIKMLAHAVGDSFFSVIGKYVSESMYNLVSTDSLFSYFDPKIKQILYLVSNVVKVGFMSPDTLWLL
jgi:aminopeptidase N